jgi:hypothetical protein
VSRHAGRITSATRDERAFSPGRFHGSWRGEVAVTVCLSDTCDVDSNVYDLRLDLVQAGDQVSGDLLLKGFGVPLTGVAAGTTVTLAGSRTVTSCHELSLYTSVCAQEVRNAVFTIDDFGRLQGELDLVMRFEDGTQAVRVRLVAVVPTF